MFTQASSNAVMDLTGDLESGVLSPNPDTSTRKSMASHLSEHLSVMCIAILFLLVQGVASPKQPWVRIAREPLF
ncbi:hypothetical protein [Endozoicomonas ascidiicola]|uniref:hypothetical protein n=1 Tax=Endozoicomonas ascidiicola TaxID=1698521 RepID=UPI000A4FE44D|nr:hypothetical protein [Endozoicomonas ascidiicola]